MYLGKHPRQAGRAEPDRGGKGPQPASTTKHLAGIKRRKWATTAERLTSLHPPTLEGKKGEILLPLTGPALCRLLNSEPNRDVVGPRKRCIYSKVCVIHVALSIPPPLLPSQYSILPPGIMDISKRRIRIPSRTRKEIQEKIPKQSMHAPRRFDVGIIREAGAR